MPDVRPDWFLGWTHLEEGTEEWQRCSLPPPRCRCRPLAIQACFCNPSFPGGIYPMFNHICSRLQSWLLLSQASALPNLVAESTQRYTRFPSSGMGPHMRFTLPIINWAEINLQKNLTKTPNPPPPPKVIPRTKVQCIRFLFFLLCIFNLKGFYILFVEGYFWRGIICLSNFSESVLRQRCQHRKKPDQTWHCFLLLCCTHVANIWQLQD